MKKTHEKAVIAFLIISILATGLIGIGAQDPVHYDNVIVLVPDGCSQSIQTAARWYKGEPLVLDSYVTGTVSTYMANSIITGSAAAATAFATGHKTTVRFLGVGPRTSDLLPIVSPTADPYAPVASVLEAAKLYGDKATGLVATSRITHATPAAYASHIDDRGKDNDIMENMVYEDIDVVFGGGFRHLIPEDMTYTTSFDATWSGKRTDDQNLLDVLLARGYDVIDSFDPGDDPGWGSRTDKVWGLFDDSHLDPELDREELHPNQPSLSEMTDEAIRILSQDEDGFFLMVEGSQVDWAGHNNDPIYMITDFLEFDEAVEVAINWADDLKSEYGKETLILVFPDHNTGGLTIGNYGPGSAYTDLTIAEYMEPLMGMEMTSAVLASKIDKVTLPNIKNAISDNWGIDISNKAAQEIEALYKDGLSLNYAIAHVVSNEYTVFGWTTFGHNGEDVPLWSYSTDGDNLPVGHFDNTELAQMVIDAWGLSPTALEDATNDLFIELDESDYSVDTTNPADPIISVGGYTINAGTDIILEGGSPTELEGVVVYAPMTGKVYVPQDCYDIIYTP
jgi:alkaline phosphatase